MDIYTGAILISLILYIAVGNYAGRRVKKLDDYYVAGRRAPTLLIVGTLVASVLSTNIFLGETGFVYEGQAGPYILWPPIGAMGYIFGALLFGRYLRRSRALTVADYFGQRFNSQRVQTAAGVTIIFGLGGYLLAVTQGSAFLLTHITDFTFAQALVICWVSYTAFTMYSGSRGVILTDTLMFLLFTSVAVASLVFLVQDAGGWSVAVRDLTALPEKPDLMAWHGMVGNDTPFSSVLDFTLWNLTLAVAWGLVYAVSPWQSSRYLIARDEHVVLRSACIAAIFLVLMELTLYSAGAVINLSDPGIQPSEEAIIYAALNLLPELMGALLLAGIVAAGLSSASTFLSLVGFSVSNDLVAHKNLDEARMLRLSRLVMLAVGVVTLIVAFYSPMDIFWLTYFVGTLFASSWGPVALMSVWSRRITADAAFWGIVSGFVFNAGPKALEYLEWITLPFWLDPILFGGLVSLVVVLAMSSVGGVSREEQAYRLELHRVPPGDVSAARTRVTRYAPVALAAYSVTMCVILLRVYVLPYQQATGGLSTDGGINWLSGEALLVLASPVVVLPSAWIAWRMIRKSYG
ncbi:MAG: sodium:solute symporter family protein [Xanthomonadales bacterium]|nr:sodium:solute symporter family protein [Gammaproteobacteria bacterium]MBT8055035.1 sodium:solute symporter family protein [Gammaproteobacteria bacterium]NND57032.1 sodium:solute symporter family protein [Xanthomonadales bacterium]